MCRFSSVLARGGCLRLPGGEGAPGRSRNATNPSWACEASLTARDRTQALCCSAVCGVAPHSYNNTRELNNVHSPLSRLITSVDVVE